MTFLKCCDNVGLMKITSDMLKKFKDNIKAWKENEYTRDIKKVYAQDRKDLTVIYNLIKKGDMEIAGKMAWNLDTIVREQIPSSVYNAIIEAYEGE